MLRRTLRPVYQGVHAYREASPPSRLAFVPTVVAGLLLLAGRGAPTPSHPLRPEGRHQAVPPAPRLELADLVPPAAGPAPQPAPLGTTPLPSPPAVLGLIRRYAALYGLDPELLTAVALVESGLDTRAVSPAGAVGPLQVLPATAQGELGLDARDLRANVETGAWYLAGLLRRYGGDLRLALGAYNAGMGAVDRAEGIPPFPETHAYVERVLRLYRRLTPPDSGGITSPARRSAPEVAR